MTTQSPEGAAPAPEPANRRETANDAVARQLLGAFLTGVVLVFPLRAALETTTYGGLHASLLGALLAVLVFGAALRLAGVPDGMALATAAAGTYAFLAVVLLWLLPRLGVLGDNTQVALFVGLVAAALSAPVASAVVQWATDSTGAWGLAAAACVIGLLFAATAGPEVNQGLLESRQEAELASKLKDSGLTPYLPEVAGMSVEYGSTTYAGTETGRRAVAYSLRYEREDESGPGLGSYVSVEVSHADEPPCDPNATFLACEDHGTFTVVTRDGVLDSVVADRGGIRMEARPYVQDGDLPSAETLGEALAAAQTVEWTEVVSAEND